MPDKAHHHEIAPHSAMPSGRRLVPTGGRRPARACSAEIPSPAFAGSPLESLAASSSTGTTIYDASLVAFPGVSAGWARGLRKTLSRGERDARYAGLLDGARWAAVAALDANWSDQARPVGHVRVVVTGTTSFGRWCGQHGFSPRKAPLSGLVLMQQSGDFVAAMKAAQAFAGSLNAAGIHASIEATYE